MTFGLEVGAVSLLFLSGLKNELKEGAFSSGGSEESMEANTKHVHVLIHPEVLPKPGPTFIMIQRGLLSVEIGG